MSKLLTHYLIATDYGSEPCPDDLVKLFIAAPKVIVVRRDPDTGMPYSVAIPDKRTDAGEAFYRREAEVVREFTERHRAEYEAAP